MGTIFINRYYWPDETATAQLLTDLAEGLAEQGKRITVIASRPPGSGPSEVRRGVTIVRVNSSRGSKSVRAKAVDYGTFFLASLWRLAQLARAGDNVVALTDPPLLGIGVRVVAGFCRLRCFQWVHDIYPEIAVALTGHRALRALRPWRNWAWRKSEGCVAIAADMAQMLITAGVDPAKIHRVPNWVPGNLVRPDPAAGPALRRSWGAEGKFVIAYSGNLGRVHDLAAILDLAAALRKETRLLFLFIGDGPQRAAIAAEATRRDLAQVRFLPSQPRASLGAALEAPDVHLVTLQTGCEKLVFPSKLYGAAWAGRPVLYIGPAGSEPGRIVAAAGFGRAFDRAHFADAAQTLRDWSKDPAACAELGAQGRQFAQAASAARAVAAWGEILDGSLSPAPSCPKSSGAA
jgi:colanic acid biosynthesis glycosyl transferase WcaI